jgi:hypothetical protein
MALGMMLFALKQYNIYEVYIFERGIFKDPYI